MVAIDAELLEDRIMMSAVPMVDVGSTIDSGIAGDSAIPSIEQSPIVSIASDANNVASDARLIDNSTDVRQATDLRRLELVFVNSNTPNYQQLIDDLLRNADSTREIEVYLLDASRDGVEQISQILAGYSEVNAIHFVSHGELGAIQLGQTWLNDGNLTGYAGQIANWQLALASDADILIYGCDIANSLPGQELVESLSALTGADVAASIDDTGHSRWGGNWLLEYQVGVIDTTIAFSHELQQAWGGKLAAITVTTFSDVINSGDGVLSLREAIIQANAGPGGDTIILNAGTYTLSLSGNGENNAATGDLELQKDVTITGTGNSTIIDANGIDRVFHVVAGNASISQLVIRGGNAFNRDGGGLRVDIGATASLSYVMLTNNIAKDGGAIDNQGVIYLSNVFITNNNAIHRGGGIGSGGSVTLSNVTLSNNVAASNQGGGIDVRSGTLTATNVTISGNASGDFGGGIQVDGAVTLQNVTITNNSSSIQGSGVNIGVGGGSVSLRNTIIAGNSGATDVGGSFSSAGNNLIGNKGTASGFVNGVNGDQVGTSGTPIDAKLRVLEFNGGFTPTHALQTGSTVINTGSIIGAPSLDQRGVARSGAVDIGATMKSEFCKWRSPQFLDFCFLHDNASR